VGKSALVGYVCADLQDLRVLRATCVEFEMEFAFAGLHQLCAPLLDRVGSLPEPQREALLTAFGLNGGGTPDPFRAALGVLGLMCDALPGARWSASSTTPCG
jgi:hypothetical protein